MSLFTYQPGEIPAIRIAQAIGAKADKDLLFVVGGGLGDMVCAEPTIRYAIETFKDCSVSVCSKNIRLFDHLNLKYIYETPEVVPKGKYLPLYTYSQGLANQFLNANLMHGVDFASISALRGQLPNEYRSPCLLSYDPKFKDFPKAYCLIHLGRSWPSRTFTVQWWEKVIEVVKKSGLPGVLVGQNCHGVPGVTFGTDIIDLRHATNLNQFIWLCQNAWAIITNDSSPVHLAATGVARIAMVATCRRPDFITHDRLTSDGGTEYGWRTEDFSKNRMWEKFKVSPNDLELNSISEVPLGWKIEDFLPEPEEIIDWILND